MLDHIDRHLDDDLDVTTLSRVAAFSPFHFHRQFSATFGITVHRYLQLLRMKRASYRLAYRSGDTVTDVAFDAGYDAPDAFARAFRRRFGQSPSSFRSEPDWEAWHAAFGPLDHARSKLLTQTYSPDDVTIRDVAPIAVAFMEHRGDPAALGATIQRFIAWRRANGLTPKNNPTFNIFHTDPRPTPITDYHVDLCVGVDSPRHALGDGIEAGNIPGGRRAVLRVVGPGDKLEAAALYLYRNWLPQSGEEAGDFSLYGQRLAFFPDVPEHEAVVDLFLPLK